MCVILSASEGSFQKVCKNLLKKDPSSLAKQGTSHVSRASECSSGFLLYVAYAITGGERQQDQEQPAGAFHH